jgi:hypothetical protein
LIAMTRTALGIGIGLLLSARLGGGARRAVGWAMVLSGAIVTIPIALEVLHKGRLSPRARAGAGNDLGADARQGFQDRTRTEDAVGAL